ncbi:MAG: MFS transporter [Spirochaetaceae bacterium]|nr:MAG: MFS transporter [Spirochaetaceae bacterium]
MNNRVFPGKILLHTIESYRCVPPQIYLLAAARAINSLGSFVILLVTIILSDAFGLGEAAAGRIIFACAVAHALGTLTAGSMLDRIPRHHAFVLMMSGHALAFAAAAFAPSIHLLAPLLVAGFFCGGMLRPGVASMAVDYTDESNRLPAFSLIYLAHNMGMIAAPLFAGTLYGRRAEWVFWGDAVSTLLCAALVFAVARRWALPQFRSRIAGSESAAPTASQADAPSIPQVAAPEATQVADPGHRRSSAPVLLLILSVPSLLYFSLGNIVINLVYSQHMFALPLRMLELFGTEGPFRYSLLLTANAVTVIALTGFVTVWSRSLKAETAMMIAGALFGVGLGLVGAFTGFTPQIALVVVWTVGEILTVTHTGVFVANQAPPEQRARFLATMPTIWGLGTALGPFVFGPIAEGFGLGVVWPILAVAALLGVLLFGYARRRAASPARNLVR